MEFILDFFGQETTVYCFIDDNNQLEYEYQETLFTDEQVIEINKEINSFKPQIKEAIRVRRLSGI
jgi:hypothetical protein